MKTGTLKIMNGRGHTEVAWSTDLQETVDAANRAFDLHLGQGYIAAEVDGPRTGRQIETFDPEVTEILLIPPMVAG